MTKITVFMIAMLGIFHFSNAQRRSNGYYNPHQAEAAYWEAFNKETQKVYRNAQYIRASANQLVNGTSRIIPKYGRVIRYGYKATNGYIQRTVTLPRRYDYNRRRN